MQTLCNAKALSIEDKVGNFATGKEADFLVIDINLSEDISRYIECIGNDIINILSGIIFWSIGILYENGAMVCGRKRWSLSIPFREILYLVTLFISKRVPSYKWLGIFKKLGWKTLQFKVGLKVNIELQLGTPKAKFQIFGARGVNLDPNF